MDHISFRLNVRNVNYFKVFFHQTEQVNGPQYYYYIEKAKPKLPPDSPLIFGKNIGPYEAEGFSVSNIGEKLNGKAAVFDLDFIVKVPFFRKGHFFRTVSITNDRTKTSTISIKHFTGYEDLDRDYPEIPFIYKDFSLAIYEDQFLPITW